VNEGDDLLRHIRGFVHGRVPASQEETVVELVGKTVVLIMTTPAFYNHLVIIQQMQLENYNLRQALIRYQQAEVVRARRAAARKAGASKKAAPKKAPAKKAPVKRATPRKAASSNVRSFMRGASGR